MKRPGSGSGRPRAPDPDLGSPRHPSGPSLAIGRETTFISTPDCNPPHNANQADGTRPGCPRLDRVRRCGVARGRPDEADSLGGLRGGRGDCLRRILPNSALRVRATASARPRRRDRLPWTTPAPNIPPTASPERPAPTCSSTRTTRSTGIPGAPRRSPGRRPRTGRSSSRSATRPATGATSWSARASRTPTIAALMNEHFVNIKVDREERPDLDQIYMAAVQAMTGHGGWPMSVFLTPDLRAVLRRHVLPADRLARDARLPARPAERRTGPGRSGGTRSSRSAGEMTEQLRAIGDGPAAGGRARRRRCSTAPPRALARAFDPTPRRLRHGPQVPAPDGPPGPAPPARPDRRRPRPAHGPAHARQDGPRRHLRPPRRRLRPLLDRRALARPALREDALRQRPARLGLPRGVPGRPATPSTPGSPARRWTTSSAG